MQFVKHAWRCENAHRNRDFALAIPCIARSVYAVRTQKVLRVNQSDIGVDPPDVYPLTALFSFFSKQGGMAAQFPFG